MRGLSGGALAGRRAVVSFSGGKDSCLALWRARQAGLDVAAAINVLDETGERNRSHGVPRALLEAQAQALDLELVAPVASWRDYEARFVAALEELRARGFEVAVFGDIDLQAHRDWEEKVCERTGLQCYLPLWHESRLALAHEVLQLGFRAIVVCVDSRYLEDRFCGRLYDAAFIADLPAGVDACGENGEFHTFVYDGPGFRTPVRHALANTESYTAPAELGGVRYCFARLESG
ncbi:MAG TPA: diphthine--ammonia ligase [Steroidobacteraceae bacterium]|nr:diphthine--ammonia ligase [Steroidobacteraceae bacterium]